MQLKGRFVEISRDVSGCLGHFQVAVTMALGCGAIDFTRVERGFGPGGLQRSFAVADGGVCQAVLGSALQWR